MLLMVRHLSDDLCMRKVADSLVLEHLFTEITLQIAVQIQAVASFSMHNLTGGTLPCVGPLTRSGRTFLFLVHWSDVFKASISM